MRIVKLLTLLIPLFVVAPALSDWEWEKTVLGCENEFVIEGEKVIRIFLASADYTRFSDPEDPNVPIIPERFNNPDGTPDAGLKYRVNRVFYRGDEEKALVDFQDITGLTGKPAPLLATCSYMDGETERCAGLLVRCAAIGGGEWAITYHPVALSADSEVEMVWEEDGEMYPGGGASSRIQSGDMAGDAFGNIHLVTQETDFNINAPNAPYSADWTTRLYYWRWDAETLEWDITGELLPAPIVSLAVQRNPDMACDSEGNVHIVYSFNDDAGTSDFGIGYIKIEFNGVGQISSITNEIIVMDGTGVMCESPDITLDDDDKPHVVYQHDGGLSNNWNVYYTTKQFAWLMPTQVPAPMGSNYCWEPSIAISRGYIHVVYGCGLPRIATVYTTANDRIFYTRKLLTGPMFETPMEISDKVDYNDNDEYEWSAIFRWGGGGYANWNHNPCVIAGDDEISVIWVGHNTQYMGPAALLARRCFWEDE